MGFPRFMSPEEFELNAMIDARTNVLNMGAMAFAILGWWKRSLLYKMGSK